MPGNTEMKPWASRGVLAHIATGSVCAHHRDIKNLIPKHVSQVVVPCKQVWTELAFMLGLPVMVTRLPLCAATCRL
jgi:hypothetical protein